MAVFNPAGDTQTVESQAPNDPDALVELGIAYWDGTANRYFDFAKARTFFGRAAKLGSVDAQAYLAMMEVRGSGMKKDEAAGITKMKQLAATNSGVALGFLGYLCYWGDHDDLGWPKNTSLAVFYSNQSAATNNGIGARNLAYLYGDGIGVTKDYALAAVYMYAAFSNGGIGIVRGSRLTNDYLAFVKD